MQQIAFAQIFRIVVDNFFHIPVVAWAMLGLFGFFLLATLWGAIQRRHNAMARFAPSVLTAAGLIGTFVGLTVGLQNFQIDQQDASGSMQALIDQLKIVFVYSLAGILGAAFFMLCNALIAILESRSSRGERARHVEELVQHRTQMLQAQLAAAESQQQMTGHVAQMVRYQGATLKALAQIGGGYDQDRLSAAVSKGVSEALEPALARLEQKIAEQGADRMRQLLVEMQNSILDPMRNAVEASSRHTEKLTSAVSHLWSSTDDAVRAVRATTEQMGEAVEGLLSTTSAIAQGSATLQGIAQEQNQTLTGFAERVERVAAGLSEVGRQMQSSVEKTSESQKSHGEALERFNGDLRATLSTIEPSIREGLGSAQAALVASIDGASAQMQAGIRDTLIQTSQAVTDTVTAAVAQMDRVVGGISSTIGQLDASVAHMKELQVEQRGTFSEFNEQLRHNLASIEPSIQRGLGSARDALVTAIAHASEQMNGTLAAAGLQLKSSVLEALGSLRQAQADFDGMLRGFSERMDQHLGRMGTELQAIGDNAERTIRSASEQLGATLGDIDTKLLDAATTLQRELEVFRREYQERLTDFLQQQDHHLEQTIGRQREGLEKVAELLRLEFQHMSEEQRQLNGAHRELSELIAHSTSAIIPRAEGIAQSLARGDERLGRRVEEAALQLDGVSRALADLGGTLPTEVAKQFELLDGKYREAFGTMDRGLAAVADRLVAAATVLVQVSGLHQSTRA